MLQFVIQQVAALPFGAERVVLSHEHFEHGCLLQLKDSRESKTIYETCICETKRAERRRNVVELESGVMIICRLITTSLSQTSSHVSHC